MARKPCTHYAQFMRKRTTRNGEWTKWELSRVIEPRLYVRVKYIWQDDRHSKFYQHQWRKITH